MARDDYETLDLAVEEVVRSETISLVESGRADVQLRTESGAHEIRPRRSTACAVSVYVQSDREVSLWPEAPGTDRAPTVDICSRDQDIVVSRLREYLSAIFAGRIELTLRPGSSAGRCRLWLSDGTCQAHFYNVILTFLVGRGSGWEKIRPSSY